jgi:hypothetical protein
MTDAATIAQQARAEDALWRTAQANTYKGSIRIWGGICGLVFAIGWAITLFVLFVIGMPVPFFPPAVLDYGWSLHLLNVPMCILALVVGATRSLPLVSLTALITALLVFPLNSWSLGANFIPWLVGCITSHPVTFFADCTTGALYTFLLFSFAVGFWVWSLIVWTCGFALINYIRGSVPTSPTKED